MLRTLGTILTLTTASPALADLDSIARLAIIPGWQTADGTHVAGFDISLAPGWKTYWRAPGDGGIPPYLSLNANSNVTNPQFLWPVPEVFDQNGIRSIGYNGGAVIPLEFEVAGDELPHLSGTLEIGICEEICVPVRFEFDVELPRNTQRNTRLLAALLDTPQTAEEANVTSVTCAIGPISDGITVEATVTAPSAGGTEAIVIETNDPTIWVSEATSRRDGDRLTGTVDMVPASGQAFALDRSKVRITILGQDHAIDIKGCKAPS